MNKLVKKPAKSPFAEAVAYGYTWTGEFKKLIEEQVKIHQELLTREAEFEGNPLLTDENFLYQKFTENVTNEEWNANWEILKFFGMNLKIKMLKYMYGEWCLTEHDKEMFDYFDGVTDREEAVRRIQVNTRHYAKRQLTWWRRDSGIIWKNAGSCE